MLETFQIILFLIIMLIFVYILVGKLIERFQIHFLHQSGIGIIVGWLVGMLVYFAYRDELGRLDFNENVFFYGLLPPIIFAAGYNLKKRKFFEYFFYIFLYGVLGTIICFLVTLGLTRIINEANLIIKFNVQQDAPRQTIQLSPLNVLLFSATICASDSVAALTLIGEQHDKIFSIVFGEGMLNDAVSIILFRSVSNITTESRFNARMALMVIGNFAYILLASVSVGIFFAVVCCLIFKKCRFLTHNPVTEVCLVVIFGLMGYAFSEMFDLSGVISLLVIGIALSHYNFYNLSMTGQVATGVSLQAVSSIAEGFIFVYLGLNFWTIFKDENGKDYWWSWSFVGFEIVICCVGRVISVYFLSALMKLIRRKNWKVNCRELNVVWYSGVVRGCVAFALILTVQANTPEQINQVQVLKSSVLFMVFFTTIFIGGLMPLVIKYSLKPSQKPIEESSEVRQKEIEMKMMGNDERVLGQEEQSQPPQPAPQQHQKKKSKAARCWSYIDEKFLKRWFIYHYVERSESIRQLKDLIRSNSQRPDHPEMEEERDPSPTPPRKQSIEMPIPTTAASDSPILNESLPAA